MGGPCNPLLLYLALIIMIVREHSATVCCRSLNTYIVLTVFQFQSRQGVARVRHCVVLEVDVRVYYISHAACLSTFTPHGNIEPVLV